ncbi:MAG: penicillin acylase family protein [Gemmatimonadota bacterium]
MNRARWQPRGVAALGVFVWLLGAAVTGGWMWLASSLTEPSGTVPLPDLLSPVTVQVDSFGVPSLYAGSLEDLARAQGYMHALDRLWQMELTRRVALGKLSEVFGERAIAQDRLMRTLDLSGRAARRLEQLSGSERALLDAYAEGVNARLDLTASPLPPEFQILRFAPEQWTAGATIAVGLVMTLDLSHWHKDLARFKLQPHLSAEKFEYLRLPYAEGEPVTSDRPVAPPDLGSTAPLEVAGSGQRAGAPAPSEARITGPAASARPAASAAPTALETMRSVARLSVRSASNAWVIAGSRTASGHPIVANDMHLGQRTPGVWYLSALHSESPPTDVAGLTLPGIPGVVVGYNRFVAWGFTNGMVDDVDFAREQLDSAGLRYREGAGWADLKVRRETIHVRGRAQPVEMEIRETVRGPLIGDGLDGLGEPLSLLWTDSRESPQLGQWGMARARTASELLEAARDFAAPHVNILFATTAGDIGFRLSGTIPARTWDGSLPVDASLVGAEWSRVWPQENHPAALNPRSGYLVSANNLQAPGLGTALSVDYAPPYRALRLTQALEVRRSWTVGDTYALQHDVRSLLADRLVHRAVQAARRLEAEGEEGALAAADVLSEWNRSADLDSPAPSLFYAWLFRLRQLAVEDEFASAPGWEFFPTDALERLVLEGDENPWVDDIRTPQSETFSDLSARAMRDAIRATGSRPWGELHSELHPHALGGVPSLANLLGLNVGPHPVAGGPNTVSPDDYGRWNGFTEAAWTPPYRSDYGPSERFVADLNPEGPTGHFVLPAGQSGNPYSRHYRSLNSRWRHGSLIEVPIETERTAARSVREFTLAPDGSGK